MLHSLHYCCICMERMRKNTPPNYSSIRTITRVIKRYLASGNIRAVILAESGGAVPPPLAYITPFPRLSVPISGCHSMELVRQGKLCVVRAAQGTVVLVNCNRWNKPSWKEETKVLTFLLGHRQVGVSLVNHRGKDNDPTTVVKTSIPFSSCLLLQSLARVLTELDREPPKPPLDCLLVEAFLRACLLQLETPNRHITRKGLRTHEMACRFIQEYSHDPATTRDRVAQHFGLNATHISRLFKCESGISFTDYLNSTRMIRAKRLLLKQSLSIKEVAARCGYRNCAYFCRIFKKQTCLTPTEYKLTNGF